jgi:hypothetical protein
MSLGRTVAELECLLAAVVLKLGKSELALTNAEIEATSGHGFELDFSVPGGGVFVRAIPPEVVRSRELPEPTHAMPLKVQ